MSEEYVFKEPRYVKSDTPAYNVFFGKKRLKSIANNIACKLEFLIKKEKSLRRNGKQLELIHFNDVDYRESVLKYNCVESYFKACRMLRKDPDPDRYHINCGYLNDNFYGFIQDNLSTIYKNLITGRVLDSVVRDYVIMGDRLSEIYLKLLEEHVKHREKIESK